LSDAITVVQKRREDSCGVLSRAGCGRNTRIAKTWLNRAKRQVGPFVAMLMVSSST